MVFGGGGGVSAAVAGVLFQQIVVCAAVHAAEGLRGENGEGGGDAVVDGVEADGFLMGEGAAIDKRGAFAEGAVGGAAFKKGDEPGDSGRDDGGSEDAGGEDAGTDGDADGGGDDREDGEVVDEGENDGGYEGFQVWNGAYATLSFFVTWR